MKHAGKLMLGYKSKTASQRPRRTANVALAWFIPPYVIPLVIIALVIARALSRAWP